jgi:hypothetical protein
VADAQNGIPMLLHEHSAAERTMWLLVQRYTGRVGYKRTVKAEGLTADPPVIDCSGWVRLLLTHGMQAQNEAAGYGVFGTDAISAIPSWSDGIIMEIETRTGFILNGPEITATSLPRCATIGVNLGLLPGLADHPRPRGLTHIAQVVRRPGDDAPFVSESIGSAAPPGIRLMPLTDWLALMQSCVQAGQSWIVDPFRLATLRSA